MDLIKIGKFISSKRKEKNLTQSELALKLYITDRAISKWENGVSLPDVGTMPLLCEILNITINDLMSGEVVDMKDNERKLEENLMKIASLKEEKDRALLRIEIVLGFISVVSFITLIFIAAFLDLDTWLEIVIISIASIIFAFGISNAIKIEQIAGYYECNDCHHKYVPTYLSVFLAPHINRTRYMRCPKCGKKSWQKKVLNK